MPRLSRYFDLNPVRANMVLHPRDNGWSSFALSRSKPQEDKVAEISVRDNGVGFEAQRGPRELFFKTNDDDPFHLQNK